MTEPATSHGRDKDPRLVAYLPVMEDVGVAIRHPVRPMLIAFPHHAALHEVRLRVDGRAVIVLFDLDAGEHQRRVDGGLGAVTSTGLLHALWLLPSDVPVPIEQVPSVKQARLRRAHGMCSEREGSFERVYSPAGRVVAVAAESGAPDRALRAAAQLPPIFERAAVVGPLGTRRRERLAAEATQLGVGLVEGGDSTAQLVVSPLPAQRGRPGVYRWWVAELAYAALTHDRTQPVS